MTYSAYKPLQLILMIMMGGVSGVRRGGVGVRRVGVVVGCVGCIACVTVLCGCDHHIPRRDQVTSIETSTGSATHHNLHLSRVSRGATLTEEVALVGDARHGIIFIQGDDWISAGHSDVTRWQGWTPRVTINTNASQVLAYHRERGVLETNRDRYDLINHTFISSPRSSRSSHSSRSSGSSRSSRSSHSSQKLLVRGVSVRSRARLTERWTLITYQWRPPRGRRIRRERVRGPHVKAKRRYSYVYPNEEPSYVRTWHIVDAESGETHLSGSPRDNNTDPITTLNQRYLAVAPHRYNAREVQLFSLPAFEEVRRIKLPSGRVVSLDLDDQTDALRVLSDDGSMRVWDADSGSLISQVKTGLAGVTVDARYQDTGLATLGSQSGIIQLWWLQGEPRMIAETRFEGEVSAIAFHPSGRQIYVGVTRSPSESSSIHVLSITPEERP